MKLTTEQLRRRIRQDNPIESVIESSGWKTKQTGGKLYACCPFHNDTDPSMLVDIESQTFKCFSQACGERGDVVDLLARINGVESKSMFKEFAERYEQKETTQTKKQKAQDYKLVATYEYQDENGESLYYVDRLESLSTGDKTFKQWHNKDGRKVPSIKGVRRVLYRLPIIQKHEEVFIAEGEKCVAALVYAGYENTTTNCGGSGGWLDSYADSLKGKRIVVFQDNDKAGEKWRDSIKKSVVGKVDSLRVVVMPEPYHDVADFVRANKDDCGEQIALMIERSEEIHKGIDLPIYSSREMTERYIASVRYREQNDLKVDLGKWLPSMQFNPTDNRGIRPLVPGDLVTIMGRTGMGKTGILQNLAVHLRPIPVLMFEIELADDLLTERFHATTMKEPQWAVEKRAISGQTLDYERWDHIFTCPQSKLTPADIEEFIRKAELKIGQPPLVVLVDYIGLVSSTGSRYERTSTIAEELKRIAKTTNTVIVMASQISRGDEDRSEIQLHDAKDSGCLSRESTKLLTPNGFQYSVSDMMKTTTLKTDGTLAAIDSTEIDSGTKECVRITLRSGKFLECTPDHRILTSEGYKPVEEIKPEESIATARWVDAPNGCVYVPQSRFLGWMLGDGCMRGDTATFTCNDKDLSEQFISESEKLFRITPLRRKLRDGMTHDELAVSNGITGSNKPNACKEWLKIIGSWGIAGQDKRIPQWFKDRADNKSVAEILSGLIDTDGCVCNSRGRVNVRFDSCSEDLAWDAMWCYARLGIHARMSKSKGRGMVFGKYHRRPLYRVLVDAGVELSRLRDILTLTPRKQKIFDEAVFSTKPSNHSDNLPTWVWGDVAAAAAEQGVHGRRYTMARCQSRKISNKLLQEISTEVDLPEHVAWLANDAIVWDNMKSIEPVGMMPVFDRTVSQDNPNFVANGIIVHNSIENSSGLVLGAWRMGDGSTMRIKVLKSTKGGGGIHVDCRMDGRTMTISEQWN